MLVEEMVTDGIDFEIEIIWTTLPPVSLAVNLTLPRHDARYVVILNVEVTCRETDKIHEAPVRVLTDGTHLPRGCRPVLGERSVNNHQSYPISWLSTCLNSASNSFIPSRRKLRGDVDCESVVYGNRAAPGRSYEPFANSRPQSRGINKGSSHSYPSIPPTHASRSPWPP